MHILLTEDELGLCRLLRRALAASRHVVDKEFALLEYLLRHAGQVLTRQQLLAHVWRYDYNGLDRAVDSYIHDLRDKIDVEASPRLLHTVRGVGYVLWAE
jgi:DNA-binding response OmpR family regulator